MTNRYKYLVFSILIAVSINNVIGQETNFASNVSRILSFDGKKLVITYDLVFQDTSQLFDIILKIYYNDKVIAPQENTLTGSWGDKVKPGTDKVILWDFPNEFKSDINKLTVEVVATKTSGPLANFDYEIVVKKPPYEVKFHNKSKNTDYFYWKFGDLKSGMKNLSDLENPVHKYRSGGTYNVELKAGNSKTKADNIIIKDVSLNMGNEKDLLKHKKLKTIFLGSAIATAGIGAYCMVKKIKLWNDWTENGNKESMGKSNTYEVIGYSALGVSGVCIPPIIIQSKKIREVEKSMSMNLIPMDKGCVLGLALTF
jgi:PKD repeat protein